MIEGGRLCRRTVDIIQHCRNHNSGIIMLMIPLKSMVMMKKNEEN